MKVYKKIAPLLEKQNDVLALEWLKKNVQPL